MTYYYLYQIINSVNNKIYVGVHKTGDLNDGYMGSGKVIRSAIAKHGIENFVKVVLEFFENAELMYARENEIVTEEFLGREDVYNLRRGGSGGFDYLNKVGLSVIKTEARQRGYLKMGARRKGKKAPEVSERLKLLHSQGKIRYDTFTGRTHSEETKAKMRESAKDKRNGEKNSQFGSIWITDGSEAKKINKTDSIPEGWRRGRK